MFLVQNYNKILNSSEMCNMSYDLQINNVSAIYSINTTCDEMTFVFLEK